MNEIFLSASVPVIGRGDYHESADPFLIQHATRELILAVIRTHRIVWGGHPSITPMIWAICEDIDVSYADSVVLYQSRFFAELFPEENSHFSNVEFIDPVADDREASLSKMREAMLSREDLIGAVFIGGMEGIEVEHDLFKRFHPNGDVVLVPAAGGAARQLAERLATYSEEDLQDVDFAKLFRNSFGDNAADDFLTME